MPNLRGLTSIVSELKAERRNLTAQLQRVDAALAALTSLNGHGSSNRVKRNISAASRRRMSAAQKARWAKSNGTTSLANGRSKRTMSASARKRIAAAQKARWAKIRPEQRKAA